MTDPTPSFAALLQQHRAAYFQTLPGRLAQLDAIAAELAQREPEPATTQALERCAHSLAGSAGTFGLAALGTTARTLELLVGAGGRPQAVAAALASLREQLRQVLRAAHAPVAEGVR